MVPSVADFVVMESPATIVVGATTHANCRVIYLPPGSFGAGRISAADLSVGAMPETTMDNTARIDVRKDQVAILTVGSSITGSMDGMPSRTYRVNRVESRDPQYHWAWVG